MEVNLAKNDFLYKFKENEEEIEELSRIEENELLQSPKFKRLQSSSPPRSNSSSPLKPNLSKINENTSFENKPNLAYTPSDEVPKTPTKPRSRQKQQQHQQQQQQHSSSIKRTPAPPAPRYGFNSPTKLKESSFKEAKISLTPAQRFEKKPGKLFSTKDILSSYEFKETIGRGAFANVYRAINKSTGDEVAIKEIFIEDDDDILELMCEIDLLKILKHENIVKYHGFIKNEKKLLIFLEYCSGGSLRTFYKKNGPLTEKQVAKYLRQVLHGLIYLHCQGVVHRDVKAANILLTNGGDIKLTDFGVSTKVSNNTIKTYSIAGTPNWMAPEIISMDGTSTASDIWSLGATIVELLTGEPLYSHLNEMAALHAIVTDEHPPIPTFISEHCKDFLMRCFEKHPTQRATAEKLLEHPWLIKLAGSDSKTSYKNAKLILRKKASHGSFNDFNSIKRFNTKKFLPLDLTTFKHSEQDVNTLIDGGLAKDFNNLALNEAQTSSPKTPTFFRPLERRESSVTADKLRCQLFADPYDIEVLQNINTKIGNGSLDLEKFAHDELVLKLVFWFGQTTENEVLAGQYMSLLQHLALNVKLASMEISESGGISYIKNFLSNMNNKILRLKAVDLLNSLFDTYDNALVNFFHCGGLMETLQLLQDDYKSDPKLPIFAISVLRKAHDHEGISKDLIQFTIFETSNTVDWIGILLMAFVQSNNTFAVDNAVTVISKMDPSRTSSYKPIFLNSMFKIHDKLSSSNQFRILKFLKLLNLNELPKSANIMKFLVNSLQKNLSSKKLRQEFLSIICSMIFSCCHLNPDKQIALINLKAFPLFQDLIESALPCSEFVIPLICELPFNPALSKFIMNEKSHFLPLLTQLLIDPVWQSNALDALVALHERFGADDSIAKFLLSDEHEFLIKSFLVYSTINFELYLEKLVKFLNTHTSSLAVNQIRLSLFNSTEILDNIFEKIEAYKFDLVVRLNLFKLLKVLSSKHRKYQNFQRVSSHLRKIKPTRILLIDQLINEILGGDISKGPLMGPPESLSRKSSLSFRPPHTR